nr:hypothetical protein [Comamonas koreensis]
MTTPFKTRWIRFIDGLRSDFESSLEIFKSLLTFFNSNTDFENDELFQKYGLKIFTNLIIENYPLAQVSSQFSDPQRFLDLLRNSRNKKDDAIFMMLRDIFESFLVMRSDEICPRCETEGMMLFKSSDNGCLNFMCNVCGYCSGLDGQRVMGANLVLATTDDLIMNKFM